MNVRGSIASTMLLLSVVGAGGGLAAWKQAEAEEAQAASAQQPEPMETVTASLAQERDHVRTTTAIGTVLALRSVTLRNELPGTVRDAALEPGAVVEAGTVLVALDVAVEEAELRALEARAALAETLLGRTTRASESRGASAADVDRAKAELDIARAEVERIRALIERKTLRAPFRARVGLADVHVGQYREQGTVLTTLQGVDEAVHVDFAVAQDVAARLEVGDRVQVVATHDATPLAAELVAIDARVDPETRNALLRARLASAERAPAPGSAVRVRVPVGARRPVVVVPISALRRSPAGDHVFVLEADGGGARRAHQRRVVAGPALGDEVVIEEGLAAGEEVAAAGSFKLFQGVLVNVPAAPPEADAPAIAGN